MNITGIAQAIRARIQADTGTGGVWQTGGTYKAVTVFFVEGPRSTSTAANESLFPYIVYDFEQADSTADTFEGDVLTQRWTVHVWDTKAGGASGSGAEGAVRGSAMVDRLFGDAIAQSNRVPTYGFHRHTLALTTTGHADAPWACGLVAVKAIGTAHEEDRFHWAIELEITASRRHV